MFKPTSPHAFPIILGLSAHACVPAVDDRQMHSKITKKHNKYEKECG
jgi:hypothetical protein